MGLYSYNKICISISKMYLDYNKTAEEDRPKWKTCPRRHEEDTIIRTIAGEVEEVHLYHSENRDFRKCSYDSRTKRERHRCNIEHPGI